MSYIRELRKLIGTQPIIMVGTNVIVLNDEQSILLQLRYDNNCWGLPGGALEMEENLEEVATRELYEETGLTAKRLTLFNIFSGQEFYYQYPNGDEVYNVITTYICTDYRGTLKPDKKEVQELNFFSIDELPDNLNPSEVPIIQSFLNYA